MDGPVDTSTAQPDAGWQAFVDKNSPQQPEQVNDPKWDDLVKSYAHPTQSEQPPAISAVGQKIAQPIIDLAASYLTPKPESQKTEENNQIDKDVQSFRNSDSFKSGLQNFGTMVNDAVMKPAISKYIDMANKTLGEGFTSQTGNYENLGVVPGSDMEKFLQNSGLMNNYESGENNPVKGIVGGAITSASAAADAAMRTFGGLTMGAAAKIGGPAPELAEYALNSPILGEAHPSLPRQAIKRIVDADHAGVLDGEDAYFNEPMKGPVPEQAPEPAPAPDIHAVARNLAPETFSTYDRLQTQQDALRGQLSDLQAQRTAPLDEQIKAIQDAKQGGYGKLQSLQAKREALIAQDTPEMAEVRQKLQENDYQMRDLAPQVSSAYRDAQEQVGTKEPEEQPPIQPPEGTHPTPGGLTKPIEEQKAAIVSDQAQKLVAAGRPEEEANAAAALVAEHYEARSERFGGKNGTAEEMYARDAAEVKAGKGAVKGREFAQKSDEEIEKGLSDKVRGKFDEAEEEYSKIPDTNGGKIINTDSARELSSDYLEDRTKSHQVHEPASWFTKQLYKKRLAEAPKDGEEPLVLFTAGGTGAGKSSAVKALGEKADQAQIIYDTNMNNFDSSKQKIDQALGAGKRVSIVYVYRDPVDALVNGALPRAMRQETKYGTGRTVPLEEHIKTHVGASEAIKKLQDHYKNDNRVNIKVFDNSFGKDNIKEIGLDEVPKLDHNEVREKTRSALDEEYKQGKISEGTYRGFASESLRDVQQKSGSGDDQELEAERGKPRPDELEQKSRGKIRLATDDAKATITLMKSANASTFIHETGHHWLDEMMRDADHELAPEDLRTDAKTVRDWLGVKDGEDIATRQHEKFARGFERYLMEGTAPSKGLAGVFAQFKTWLSKIYQTVEKLRSPINDDIRDVFDRLLAKNPEKTVLAPDHEPGSLLANIHERDVTETPVEKAPQVADNIINEIKSTAKLHGDTEAENAIAEAEKNAGVAGNQPSPEPAPTNPTAPEPATVGTSGGATPAEGHKPAGDITDRPKPTGTETIPGGRNAEPSGTEIQSPETGFGGSKSYFIDKKGVINFDLFKTPEDIQRYLQEWSEKNPDKINEARGGVVTLEQTAQLAESMGMTTKDLLSRKVGELYDGPKQVAAAQLFIQSAKRIKEAADLARASGDPQKIADFFADLEDHKDFQDMFLQQVGISAEASRALGARRAIRKLGGFQEALDIGELFQRMTGVNMKDAKAQADLFASLEDPAQIARMAQKTKEANWFDYAIAYRNNNLLSGPVTHLHYLDGNIINALYKPLKTAVASLLPGGPQLGEAGAMYNSMVMGSVKGWQAAKQAWRDGLDKTFQSTVENYKRPTKTVYNPVFEKFFNVSSRAIGSIHSFGYSLNYEQEIARQGFRQALTEGLKEGTEDFSDRISYLQTNPTEAMMKSADDASKQAMYMKTPEYGTALSTINSFANRTAVGRFLFPFAKMELNVKVEGLLNNTALGLFSKDVRANLLGANGPETRAIQIASMSMGTALAGSVWAMGDAINGNGPSSANERKVWLLTHSPNSIQIGDIAIPLRALGNVGQVLMAGAEIKEAFNEMTAPEAQNTAAMFMEHVSRTAFQGTFIQSASDTVNAWTNPVQYGDRFLQNVAEGFVPYTTLLAQTNRYIDPFQRDVKSQGISNIYGVTDYVKSRIPFASQTLQPRVDVLGNPIPSDSGLAAGSYDKYIENPVVQKLQSMGLGLTPSKRDIMGVKLTPEQYNEFAVTSGTLIQQRLWNQNGYGVLQEPGFDNLPRAAQVKEVDKAIKLARKAASGDMLFRYPEIMDQATAKKQQAELAE